MTLSIAWQDLRHHRREAAGVVLLVALGMWMFVAAMSFVATVSDNADRLLFGTVGAPWVVEATTDDDELAPTDAQLQAFGDEVTRPRFEADASLAPAAEQADETRPDATTATLVGVDLANEDELADNFGLGGDELPVGDRQIVLHERLADQIGVETGDEVTVTAGTSTETFEVVAVAAPRLPSFTIESWALVDRTDAAELATGDPARVTQILLDPPANGEDATVQDAVADLGDGAELSWWQDTGWSSLGLAPQIWTIVLLAVFTFTFLIICIGLTTLVYSAILARLRDVAILRAAGMSPGQVQRVFLTEVVLQYVMGFAIAAALAAVTTLAVDAAGPTSDADAFTFAVGSTELALTPTWWAYAAPGAIGLALVVSVLWVPVRRIGRQPVLELLELSA